MDNNSESIYGTRPGPIQGVDWCRTTVKDGIIYLHIFDWNDSGRFELDHDIDLKSASWLDSNITDELSVTAANGRIVITTSQTMPSYPVTVIRLQTNS
jgi:alpha-L-fucosidase